MATVINGTLLGLNILTYLPANFDKAKSYPCLVFLPGAGEHGKDISLLSVHGPFQYLKSGVDLGLDLMVVAIQSTNDHPQPAEVQSYITALKTLYTNIGEIVATGLSRGGESWDWFICASENNLAQISGLVMASSQGPVTDLKTIPASWQPSLLVKHKIPYWFICGDQDTNYDSANGMLGREKSLAALDPTLTTMTVFKGSGHDASVWGPVYDPKWKGNAWNTDIYTWASKFGASVVVSPPPVVIPPPVVVPPVVTPKTIKSITIVYSDDSSESKP